MSDSLRGFVAAAFGLPEEADGARTEAGVWAALARQLLASGRAPSTPAMLDELLRRGADLLLERCPGLSLALWLRDPSGERLVYRTGALAGMDPAVLRVPPAEWDAAFAATGGVAWRGSSVPRGVTEAWGRRDGVHGLLLAGDEDPSGGRLARARPGLELLRAHLDGVGGLADGLAGLLTAQRRLEGGLSTLHEVASAIASHPSQPSDTLGAVVGIVAKALNADLCAFLLHDDKTDELVTQPGGYGLTGDEGSLYRLPLSQEEASSVRVFRTGKAFMTGDAMNDPQVLTRYAKLWKCHSLIVVPLTLENRRLGVMRVGSFQKDFFTEDHRQFVELIAEEAVVLIESAMLNSKLAETNQRLAQIGRIKDDFVSTVSHEFKTPLTSIKGFVTVLLDGTAGPISEEQRKFLGIVASASDRLSSLVSDLLDLSKLEGGAMMEFGAVEPAELARQSVASHEYQAQRRSLRLALELPERLPAVRGDAKWLRQVLDNLVSNAVKFTPDGGTVTLSVVDRGELVWFTVADTGIGIGPDDLQHIFEKFYRAKSRGELNPPGTGLGLAIAKSIVDKHEGRLWAESEPGKGSKFHVVLPVAKAAGE